MLIKEKLKELIQKEQYTSMNMSSKILFLQSVGQEACDVIAKKLFSTREDTIINSTYKKLSMSIQEVFGLNSPYTFTEKIGLVKELNDSFIKDARVILVQDIKRQAEYQQIIAIPNSMDTYAALINAASLLKINFNLSEEDLAPQRKMRI